MTYQAPTVDQIAKRVRAAFRAAMPGSEPGMWPNNQYVVTKVFAQIANVYFQHIEWVRKQRHAHLADSEGLDEHGIDYGITRAPATMAAGAIRVTADIGTTVPAGTRFLRIDGAVFETDDEVITSVAVTDIPSHAFEPGRAGNTEAVVVFTLETPLSGVTASEVGPDGIGGGVDIENDASLRARILDRKRNPPLGGAPSEYVTWAREHPGVTKVWVRRATPTAGQVTVNFMMDFTYADGIPLAGDVAAVLAIIDGNAPAAAGLVVAAPVAQAMNITISGLSPNTQAVRDEIASELKAMIRRRAFPGTFEAPFVFSRSWLAEAISITTDEERHVLTVPSGDVTFQAAAPNDPPKIATLGTLTFV